LGVTGPARVAGLANIGGKEGKVQLFRAPFPFQEGPGNSIAMYIPLMRVCVCS